jgi:hypothetical protein
MSDVQQAVPVAGVSEAIRKAKQHAGRVLGISWCNLEEISRVELILNELERSRLTEPVRKADRLGGDQEAIAREVLAQNLGPRLAAHVRKGGHGYITVANALDAIRAAFPDPIHTREGEGATYAVDDQGRFCRHCGRASWLHYRVKGVGNLCERPENVAEFRSALIGSLSAELDGSYDCGRVWSAWSYGTMGEDDFSPITDRVEEIADGIIAALNARGGA